MFTFVVMDIVPPIILQWDITDNSSGSINGSCTATSNPRSLLIVTIPSQAHYDYQTHPIIINRYTTRVEFEISQVTQDCQVDIYCFAINYPQNLPEKKTFNITIGSMSLYIHCNQSNTSTFQQKPLKMMLNRQTGMTQFLWKSPHLQMNQPTVPAITVTLYFREMRA